MEYRALARVLHNSGFWTEWEHPKLTGGRATASEGKPNLVILYNR